MTDMSTPRGGVCQTVCLQCTLSTTQHNTNQNTHKHTHQQRRTQIMKMLEFPSLPHNIT